MPTKQELEAELNASEKDRQFSLNRNVQFRAVRHMQPAAVFIAGAAFEYPPRWSTLYKYCPA